MGRTGLRNARKGRCIMSVTDSTQRTPATGRERPRTLTVAVAILSVLVIGLGAWLIYELQASGPTAVSSDVEELLDDYAEAWNTHDSDGFLELVSSDYRFYGTAGQPGMTAEETAGMISTDLAPLEFSVETVGSLRGIGDEASLHVTALERYSSLFPQQAETGASVFHLVKNGDTWEIQAHQVMD